MSLTQQIAKNTIFQVISKIVALIIGAVVIGIMTRYLGKEGFGEYSTIVAYLAFFGILADFGLQITTVNLMNSQKYNPDTVFQNAFTIRVVSACILFLIAPLVVLALPYSYNIMFGTALLTINFFALALHQLFIGLFQQKLQMHKVAIAEIAGKIILLAGVAYVAYANLGFFAMLIAIAVSTLLQIVIMFAYANKVTILQLGIQKDVATKIISDSWPIALSIVFNLIYFKADTLILSLTRTQQEVGIYSAPYRILEILIGYPYLFVGLLFPLMAQAWAMQDIERYKKVMQKTFDLLLMITIPLLVGTYLVADKLMILIAGPEFFESIALLKILILATGCIFMNVVFGYSIVVLNKQRDLIFGYATTAIIALALYLWLIPLYGAIAAAWITVGAEGLMLIINYIVSTRTSKTRPTFQLFPKIVFASIIMGVAVYYAVSLSLFIIVPIACLIYATLLILTKAVDKDLVLSIIKKSE